MPIYYNLLHALSRGVFDLPRGNLFSKITNLENLIFYLLNFGVSIKPKRITDLAIPKSTRRKRLEYFCKKLGMTVTQLRKNSPNLYDKYMHSTEKFSLKDFEDMSGSSNLQKKIEIISNTLKDGVKQFAIIECRSMPECCALLKISQPMFYRLLREVQEDMKVSAKHLKLSGDSLTVEFAERYKDRVSKLNKKTNTSNEIADVLALKELRENDKDYQGFLMKSGILKNAEPTSLDTLLNLFGVERVTNENKKLEGDNLDNQNPDRK